MQEPIFVVCSRKFSTTLWKRIILSLVD